MERNPGAAASARLLKLLQVGVEMVLRDCVGAVQLLPEGEAPGAAAALEAEPLDEAAVARLLRATSGQPAADGGFDAADLRISIAGVQEKTALLWHEHGWWRLLQEDLCQATATPADRKHFSIALLPGGAFAMTPLHDVLSFYPLLGDAPDHVPAARVELAMAVRSRNVHWRMRDVLRRHWVAVGTRHGVIGPNGEDADALIQDLVDRTPGVVEQVRNALPAEFPEPLADALLGGLTAAAQQLDRSR